MALTPQDVQQFHQHGFVTIDRFYGEAEIRAIRGEVERFKREGLLRNVARDGDGVTKTDKTANLQLCPMVQHSTLFRALPFDPKVIEAVEQLIGSPIILHLDQVFLKPPRLGMGTNWHQDNAYFKIRDPMKGTAMWISVHDATIANGTMHLIPDAFNERFEHARDPMSNHHIRCWPDESTAVPIELKAGGVAFFCYGTPHCTRANTSDQERAGVAYHFLHVDHARDKEDLIAEDRDYRPYLTGPNATGGEREYGVRVEGTWDQEVQQALAAAPA